MYPSFWQAKRTENVSLVVSVAAILVTAIAGSQGVEFFINRVLRPDLAEWSWISEILMIAAFSVTTTLWARLRLAQTAVLALERERVRSQAELAVAANVQRGLLPAIPAPSDGITWFAAMEPAGLVGGDYYDFFEDADGRMWLLVADVSGKGVPAAVFVSNTRAVVRAVAHQRRTPARLLRAVSAVLRSDGGGDVYVTCFAALVDPVRRSMVYANAGHPPGLVLHGNSDARREAGGPVRALSTGGPPLGLVLDARYEEETVALSGGDLVVVVSDGITDALNASGEEIPRLVSAAVSGLHTPREACHALLGAAATGPGPEGSLAWSDDRTVLAFQVNSRT